MEKRIDPQISENFGYFGNYVMDETTTDPYWNVSLAIGQKEAQDSYSQLDADFWQLRH